MVVLVARVVSELVEKHHQHAVAADHQEVLHVVDDDDVSICTPTSSTSAPAPVATPMPNGVREGHSSVTTSSILSIQLMIDNLCVLLAGMYSFVVHNDRHT